jgi:methylated-DNA-protein-cysteine methyltransferase related protein
VTFQGAVYALVRRVPSGHVVTYGQVAALVGRARSARAVGGAIARCPDDVPWHRVVNAQGRISRRRSESGMLTQRIRLEQEGVRLKRGRVSLTSYLWDSLTRSNRPQSRPARTGGRWGGRYGPAVAKRTAGKRTAKGTMV